MKAHLATLLEAALTRLKENSQLPIDSIPAIKIEAIKNPKFGDFSCNIAMTLAKQARCAPRTLAEQVVAEIANDPQLRKIDIAGPGFINFTLEHSATTQILLNILQQKDTFGHNTSGQGTKVLIEFVSANPTGPLHVGHGRGAAYGDCVANLLDANGFAVSREYYVNDAGRQMDILTTSTWIRYLALCQQHMTFPDNGYKGEYIEHIAEQLHQQHKTAFSHDIQEVTHNTPDDESRGGDKEKHIDALIHNAKLLLKDNYRTISDFVGNLILDNIRNDLENFGVRFDRWFSERSLFDDHTIEQACTQLKSTGDSRLGDDGNVWFLSTRYGDEKDRVLIRENGQSTYFASDVAYHLNKLQRGFDQLINIWGADHHGYVARVKAALQAMGQEPKQLDILLVQFVSLFRQGKKAQMSTRSGSFVTLKDLQDDVGKDAARFFYVMRKCEQTMDFDLDLAKSQSQDNPVYYVQYAHARICSVFRQLQEQKTDIDMDLGKKSLSQLTESYETDLIMQLTAYPELLKNAASRREPHTVAQYLRTLSQSFHTYYNACVFLTDDAELRNARLLLIHCTRQVISNALTLLGVTAPERM